MVVGYKWFSVQSQCRPHSDELWTMTSQFQQWDMTCPSKVTRVHTGPVQTYDAPNHGCMIEQWFDGHECDQNHMTSLQQSSILWRMMADSLSNSLHTTPQSKPKTKQNLKMMSHVMLLWGNLKSMPTGVRNWNTCFFYWNVLVWCRAFLLRPVQHQFVLGLTECTVARGAFGPFLLQSSGQVTAWYWWRKTLPYSKTPLSGSIKFRSGDCAGHGRLST